jgi:phage/plasmid-like protein (TIGR03299 family)
VSVWDDYDPSKDQTVQGWGGAGAFDVHESPRPADSRIEEVAPGQHSFAAVRAGGWHKLGTVFDEPVSAEKLLTTANADYDVFLLPDAAVVTDTTTGATYTVNDPTKRKICRRHPVTGEIQVLGTSSPNYQVVSNRQAFIDFGDQIIDTAEPVAATCGVLYQGKRAFMCWRLPRDVKVGGVDEVQLWMLVCHSHDLSQPLIAALTPLRTACANTERWNLRNSVWRWSMKKTANAQARLQDVREALKLSYAYADEMQELGDALLSSPMSVTAFDKIIAREFGPADDITEKRTLDAWDRKRGALIDLFAKADTQANIRGTAWAGLNAVGEYCDWSTRVQAGTAAAAGFDNPDGYRFWRSIEAEKTVTNPKNAMLRAVREYASA